MSIRAKLRDAAEIELQKMIELLEAQCLSIVGDHPVEPHELCRLLSTKSNKTLMRKVVGKMADEAENVLIAQMAPPEQY